MGYEATDDEAELIDAYEAFWRNFADAPGLKYGIAQIERSPDTGQLHIQAYTEWAQSKRRSEVYKILPSDLDFRRGSRDVARDYCRKTDSRVKVLPELGEWRKEKPPSISPKQRALSYLRDGLSPADICAMDPECYFTHWRSINAVWGSLQMQPIEVSAWNKALEPLSTSDTSSEHGKKEERLLRDEEEE